jgi:hypothetical protein
MKMERLRNAPMSSHREFGNGVASRPVAVTIGYTFAIVDGRMGHQTSCRASFMDGDRLPLERSPAFINDRRFAIRRESALFLLRRDSVPKAAQLRYASVMRVDHAN